MFIYLQYYTHYSPSPRLFTSLWKLFSVYPSVYEVSSFTTFDSISVSFPPVNLKLCTRLSSWWILRQDLIFPSSGSNLLTVYNVNPWLCLCSSRHWIQVLPVLSFISYSLLSWSRSYFSALIFLIRFFTKTCFQRCHVTGSSQRCPLRYHSLVCSKNNSYLVGIKPLIYWDLLKIFWWWCQFSTFTQRINQVL